MRDSFSCVCVCVVWGICQSLCSLWSHQEEWNLLNSACPPLHLECKMISWSVNTEVFSIWPASGGWAYKNKTESVVRRSLNRMSAEQTAKSSWLNKMNDIHFLFCNVSNSLHNKNEMHWRKMGQSSERTLDVFASCCENNRVIISKRVVQLLEGASLSAGGLHHSLGPVWWGATLNVSVLGSNRLPHTPSRV